MDKTIYQELIDKRHSEARILNFLSKFSNRNLMLLEKPTNNTDWEKFNRELELFLVRNRCKFERQE